MVSASRQDPPAIESNQIIDLVSKEELDQELSNKVYSKKAIDDTLKDLRDTLQKQQDQINDLFESARNNKIEIIHESPWQKLRNALRL